MLCGDLDGWDGGRAGREEIYVCIELIQLIVQHSESVIHILIHISTLFFDSFPI